MTTMSQTDPTVNDSNSKPQPDPQPTPLAPIASTENLEADIESELNKALEGKSVEQFMEAATSEKPAPAGEDDDGDRENNSQRSESDFLHHDDQS